MCTGDRMFKTQTLFTQLMLSSAFIVSLTKFQTQPIFMVCNWK